MKNYVITFLALLGFVGLNFGLSFLPLHAWHVPVTLILASLAALTIAIFFMHLHDQPTPNRVAALVGIMTGLILIILSVLDVNTRPSIEPEAFGVGALSPVPRVLQTPRQRATAPTTPAQPADTTAATGAADTSGATAAPDTTGAAGTPDTTTTPDTTGSSGSPGPGPRSGPGGAALFHAP